MMDERPLFAIGLNARWRAGAGRGLWFDASLCGLQSGQTSLLEFILRRQGDLVRAAVKVHYHAREQGAALVIFTEVEVRHFEGQIRGDILQLSVLPDFELVVLRSRLQILDVRRVQNHARRADGVADARITFVRGDRDYVRHLLERRDLLLLDQLGADQGVLRRDGEHHAVEVIEVGIRETEPDYAHVEVPLHPVVRLRLGQDPVSSHVYVVVKVLKLRFPFELRRRDVDLVAHALEEVDPDRRLTPTGGRGEIGDDDGVLAREVFEDDPQVRGVHQVLQVGAAGGWEHVHQGPGGGHVTIQLQKLDGGPPEVRLPPVGRKVFHPGVVGDLSRV